MTSVEPRSSESTKVRLTRTVRVSVPLDDAPTHGINGHNARPAPSGYAVYAAFDVSCEGTPDPETGYLISIQEIDAAFRGDAAAILKNAINERASLLETLDSIHRTLDDAIPPRVTRVAWWMTPNQSLVSTTEEGSPDMTRTLLRERFEFAAAHRLAVPERSEEENFETFGKCANPNFHGHNYVLEVAVKLDGEPRDTHAIVASIVDEHAVDALDHKNLNRDVPAFDQSSGGVIPSVEHIARFCYDAVRDPIRAQGLALDHVTVWETERTSCTYPA